MTDKVWCHTKYCRTRFNLTKEQQKQHDRFPETSMFHIVFNCPVHDIQMGLKFDVAVEVARRERLKEKGRLITTGFYFSEKGDHICFDTIYDRASKGDELCIKLYHEIMKTSLKMAKKKVKVNA